MVIGCSIRHSHSETLYLKVVHKAIFHKLFLWYLFNLLSYPGKNWVEKPDLEKGLSLSALNLTPREPSNQTPTSRHGWHLLAAAGKQDHVDLVFRHSKQMNPNWTYPLLHSSVSLGHTGPLPGKTRPAWTKLVSATPSKWAWLGQVCLCRSMVPVGWGQAPPFPTPCRTNTKKGETNLVKRLDKGICLAAAIECMNLPLRLRGTQKGAAPQAISRLQLSLIALAN